MDTQELVSQIRQADGAALGDIAQALMDRYNTLFPNDEVFFLSLPKNNPQERQRLLQMMQNLV